MEKQYSFKRDPKNPVSRLLLEVINNKMTPEEREIAFKRILKEAESLKDISTDICFFGIENADKELSTILCTLSRSLSFFYTKEKPKILILPGTFLVK